MLKSAATRHSGNLNAAFGAVAEQYDARFSDSAIGRAQRRMVWKEMDRVFQRGQRIVEINCGTGIDALRLANRGIRILACDAAPEMIAIARERLLRSSGHADAEARCLPTEELGELVSAEPYDGALSDFAGLDCVADLPAVARSLARLVRPGGHALICVFGGFCLWETLWYAVKGDLRRAFRRLNRNGVSASLSTSANVTVHYRSVRALRTSFAPWFRLERWRGVGVASPPSYAESVALRFPWIFGLAVETDMRFGSWPGYRALADHALLVLTRTEESVQ